MSNSLFRRRVLRVAVLALMTMACSSARPVLYPNEHFKSVGQSVADADIAECENMAKAAGADRGLYQLC